MEEKRHIVRVYVGALSQEYEALSVEASKHTAADEIVSCIVQKLGFPNPQDYELAEVIGNSVGQECKERRLSPFESPVALKLLWPKSVEAADSVLMNTTAIAPVPGSLPPSPFQNSSSSRNRTTSNSSTCSSSSSQPYHQDQYRFCLREKLSDSLWSESFAMDPQVIKDYFYRFLYQPADKEYPDLCQLPDLNEETLLENLRSRFTGGHIYTYVGSILIAVNPFKFHPIYNPKYVKLYQNRRREELPPHIFAIADSAYHAMLKEKRNQCIVISGESGSGKTESTNFLLHHLTALSQKGTHGSGVEQTILSAGPVLEAFGNAKTAHNNNSSRFGKFIQVSYRENGMVHGAIVQKYLLEKSRICWQAKNERNYHVFYYLLAGANESEKNSLALLPPSNYHYLNQSGCYTLEGVDESYEFSRLKQSMEMVGFGADKQRKLFSVLSAVLLLGNVEFLPKKSSYHHDESVLVKNPEVVRQISSLLRVTEETLTAALTSKRARVSGEMLVIHYRMPEARASAMAMAKCLYGALFDWIVLQVNHALLSKKDPAGTEATGKSIGVLDIFGFEDFQNCNSFEQYCINYANEHLQNYFNQHVFKYEQEEYKKEGIKWTNIGYMDNTPCLSLIEAKPNGLICILDDQCNFPGATNETLLQKFNSVHKEHEFYEVPQRREPAFIIRHYAGKVKYQVMEFREKNMDLMRHDIVSVLKNSSLAFVRELVGIDPVAVFRWAILRAFFRAFFAFNEAGYRYRMARAKSMNRAFSSPGRRRSSNNEHLLNDLSNLEEMNKLNQSELIESYNYIKYKPIRRNYRANYTYYNQNTRDRLHPLVNNGPLTNCHDLKNGLSLGLTLLSPNNNQLLNYDKNLHSYQNGNGINGHRVSTPGSPHVNGSSKEDYEQHNHQSLSKAKECPCCYPTMPSEFTYLKNRSFRSQPLVTRGMKNLQSVKTLASHAVSMGISNKQYNPRKQPISVSQQFQQSLHSLMITLNQANPFFIRCIKSNSDKSPNKFDDEIVQRQLRYTGMLETVRIRQAGYNVRLAFEEFVNIYRILLPNGLDSDRNDIGAFLLSLTLNRSNYQLGKTKIFLREVEKVKLDYFLHQQIMSSIVAIQRWYRTTLERRHFLHVREAIIRIQAYIRMFIAQKLVVNLRIRHLAATYIQKIWRGYKVRKWYEDLRSSCIQFQARFRGQRVRQKYQHVLEQQRKLSKQKEKLRILLHEDGESTQSMNEKFSSKGSSQQELDENHQKILVFADVGDSEGSSGIHEDSENEFMLAPAIPPRRHATQPSQPPTQMPLLSDSMPALTLALTSTPFSLGRHYHSLSQSQPSNQPQQPNTVSGGGANSGGTRSGSPGANERDASHKWILNKKKLSLKLRKGEREEDSTNFGNKREEEETGSLERDENGHGSKNPFHRAKKHIKTFISGSKQKQDKHEAMLLESDESDADDGDTLTCNSNSNSSSTPSTLTLDQNEPGGRQQNHSKPLHNSRLSLDSKLKSQSMDSHPKDFRHTRSLHYPITGSSSSIPEHNYNPTGSRSKDFQQHQHQRFHRKIARGDDYSYGNSPKTRHDRRDERRKLIAERSVDVSRHTFATSGQESLDRRASEDLISDSDYRRGSRDSNQSAGGSPSHSSQDSLFDRGPSQNVLTQSLSYGYGPVSGVPSTSILMGATAHRKVHIREDASQIKASSTPDMMSSRDVRRTRSVSESRPDGHKKEYPSTTPFGSTELSSEEILSSSTNIAKKFQNIQNGHTLEKMTKYHKGETCVICRKNLHVLFAPGCRCERCRMLFHTKCLAGGIPGKPCLLPNTITAEPTSEVPINQGSDSPPSVKSQSGSGRKKYRKPSKSTSDITKSGGKFNLTGTSEFTDRTDQIISGVKELQLMQEFISKKIYQVRQKEGERVSTVDRVFHQALCEFKESLVSVFSVASKQGGGMPLNIKYKDLIGNFANIMETVCKHEGTACGDFPTTMGVNAFRGFLNEFMNANRVEEKPKATKLRKDRSAGKQKGSKRQKVEESISHMGHSFVTMVINIPTACEVCSSFIMWPIERGVVCQKCKLACHKKCHLKIFSECHESHGRTGSSGSESGIFGASLRSLVNEDVAIPVIVEQLVTAIEFYGLRQEGLYRKSGVSSRVRELKQDIEDGKDIDWNIYPVHVLTSVLKSFFRELPEPLLTYELYDEFLRAADLSQPEDRIHTTFAILKKLPKQNYDLMERLVFHLVRVCLYEEKNRMNANSLSIVFAPCILRTNKTQQVQHSLNDISRQTLCIETVVSEQLKKVRETLSSIESVDSARHSFSVRLNSIRSSKMKSPPERKKMSSGSTGSLSEGSNEKSMNESTTPESMSAEEEEEYLTRHLKHLQDEKAMLTSVLPSLSRTPSDDDMLSTDPEVDSPGGSVDDLNLHRESGRTPSPRQNRAQSLQYSKSDSLVVDAFNSSSRHRLSPTLRLPATSPLLQLIKNKGPVRKPPSRFARNLAVVDFGEGENEEEDEHHRGEDDGDDEDDSVHSVDHSTADDAIIV